MINENTAHYKSRNTVAECCRLMPRGLKLLLVDNVPANEMPEACRTWLIDHEMLRPAKKKNGTGWTWTALGKMVRIDMSKKLGCATYAH